MMLGAELMVVSFKNLLFRMSSRIEELFPGFSISPKNQR